MKLDTKEKKEPATCRHEARAGQVDLGLGRKFLQRGATFQRDENDLNLHCGCGYTTVYDYQNPSTVH